MTMGYDNLQVNQSLVLDLQFRETTGTVTQDWAKPYHPVTLVNTPTWAVLGNDLTYLSFDNAASEHLLSLAAASTALNFTTGSFSGAVWFYPDLYGSRTLLSKTDGVTGWKLAITSGDNHVYVTTYQAGPTLQSTYGAANLALSVWQLVGFTRSGADVRIYLNGYDATVVPATHVNPATAAAINFSVGSHNAASEFIDGRLWRPRVWERTLEAGEFFDIYEAERHLFGV